MEQVAKQTKFPKDGDKVNVYLDNIIFLYLILEFNYIKQTVTQHLEGNKRQRGDY